jgi:hypothetical protein
MKFYFDKNFIFVWWSIRSPVLYVKEILAKHFSLSGAKAADLSGPKKRASLSAFRRFHGNLFSGVDDHTEIFNLYGLNSPSLVTKKNIPRR